MSLHSEVSRDDRGRRGTNREAFFRNSDAVRAYRSGTHCSTPVRAQRDTLLYIHSSAAVRLRETRATMINIGDSSSELGPHVEASDRREHTSVTSERQTETSAPLRTPRKASLDSRRLSRSVYLSFSLSLFSPPTASSSLFPPPLFRTLGTLTHTLTLFLSRAPRTERLAVLAHDPAPLSLALEPLFPPRSPRSFPVPFSVPRTVPLCSPSSPCPVPHLPTARRALPRPATIPSLHGRSLMPVRPTRSLFQP